MQNSPKCCSINGEKPNSLTSELVSAIENKLRDGYLVELMRLRDGTIVARSVKKKEITAVR